ALRNKRNHYEDMPEDVKRRVGGLPDGYLNYWTSRFPKLLLGCHDVVLECGLEKTDRFQSYFRKQWIRLVLPLKARASSGSNINRTFYTAIPVFLSLLHLDL
ncbi:hypothetical protein LTR28_010815, partial [Elasticomyces elasticus]